MPNASPDAGKVAPAGPVEAPLAPTETDLDALLPILGRATTDPVLRDKLRQSREFMGFAGQIATSMAKDKLDAETAKATRETREKAEREMVELARTDPVAFSEKYLGDYEKAKTAMDVAQMRSSVEEEFGKKIGTAIATLPEFKELSPEENERIVGKMTGVPKEEVLERFTAAALDVIADKRADARLAKYIAEKLPVEAKALAKEQAAKDRARQARPSLRAGTQTGANPEPDWRKEPAKWDAWYEATHPGAKPATVR